MPEATTTPKIWRDPRPRPRITPNWRLWTANAAWIVIPSMLVVWLYAVSTAYFERDAAGAISRVCAGVIVDIATGMSTRGNLQPASTVTLRLGDQTASYSTVYLTYGLTRPMRQGDRVRVTYGIGRSGRIYIDKVEPSQSVTPRDPVGVRD